MKFKNYQIKHLIKLLDSLTLKGKESRMRTKFLKVLIEHYNSYIINGLSELQKEFAIKDENGEIEFLNEEKTKFNVNSQYFHEEEILLFEDFIFDISESNKDMLLVVCQILLDGEFEVDGTIASMYDEWCDNCENTINYYNQ